MSGIEEKLVNYISDARFEDVPTEVVDTAKNMILTIIGTTIAGAMAMCQGITALKENSLTVKTLQEYHAE